MSKLKVWYLCRVVHPEHGDTVYMNVFDDRESCFKYIHDWSKRDNIVYDYYIKECVVDEEPNV